MKASADGMAMSPPGSRVRLAGTSRGSSLPGFLSLALSAFLAAGSVQAESPAEAKEKPADLKLAPADPAVKPAHGSARFLRELVLRPRVNRSDCLMAAALVEDPAAWKPDKATCLEILKDVPGLDAKGMGPFDRAASRAFGSLLIVKVLRIEGGILLRMMPSSGRYAYRELESRGMVAPGGPDNALTGEELAGLVEAAGREKARRRGDGEP